MDYPNVINNVFSANDPVILFINCNLFCFTAHLRMQCNAIYCPVNVCNDRTGNSCKHILSFIFS